MTKRALSAVIVLVLTLVSASLANAQTPIIAVYFDPGLSDWGMDCPGFVVDTLYVAGVYFNAMVTGAEFAVSYPAVLTWLADTNVPPVTIGQTPTGISMGYSPPRNGFLPVELCRVLVFWNCDECETLTDTPIKVTPNPATAFLGWTDLAFAERPAYGATSRICPFASPVEQTTWGRVKSLFAE